MHKREVKVFHVTDFLRQSIGKSRKKNGYKDTVLTTLKHAMYLLLKHIFKEHFFKEISRFASPHKVKTWLQVKCRMILRKNAIKGSNESRKIVAKFPTECNFEFSRVFLKEKPRKMHLKIEMTCARLF